MKSVHDLVVFTATLRFDLGAADAGGDRKLSDLQSLVVGWQDQYEVSSVAVLCVTVFVVAAQPI